MKRIVSCILIVALMCCAAAFADVPKLGESMFKYAKNALTALANGAYDKLVTKLPFSDMSPSVNEWRNLAEGGFTRLSGTEPQVDYAAAYWNGSAWVIAVPVEPPASGDVEALTLITEDGKTFCGYGCALWRDVEKALHRADYVQWNEEYNGSTSVVIEMDED